MRTDKDIPAMSSETASNEWMGLVRRNIWTNQRLPLIFSNQPGFDQLDCSLKHATTLDIFFFSRAKTFICIKLWLRISAQCSRCQLGCSIAPVVKIFHVFQVVATGAYYQKLEFENHKKTIFLMVA